MLMCRRMLTVRSSDLSVLVMRTETRAHRPAQWKHGKYGDDGRADAASPHRGHHPSISPSVAHTTRNLTIPRRRWGSSAAVGRPAAAREVRRTKPGNSGPCLAECDAPGTVPPGINVMVNWQGRLKW